MRKALALFLAISFLATTHAVAGETHSCFSCGQPIEGAFFETKGAFYHPEHFTCAQCSRPITGAYTTYRSENYHNECFRDHIARRCSLCRQIIEGQYVVDYWGNAYHAWHERGVPSCDFCDRLITSDLERGGVRFSDGRYLCRICHASSIKRIGQARVLMAQVATQLERIGMHFDLVDLELHLIGIKRMQKLANYRSHDLRGFTDYHEERNLFGRTKRRQIDVYLLYGMPRVEMIGTLAHELTHVWQFLNGRLDSDRALSEGSSNFASYWVLKQMAPGEETNFIIESMLRDEDAVYGEGFRRIKRYVEQEGIANWLALMAQKDAKLPQ